MSHFNPKFKGKLYIAILNTFPPKENPKIQSAINLKNIYISCAMLFGSQQPL